MDNRLLNKMIEYFNADPKRIQHFIKVYAFAKMIGEEEGLDEKTRYILETAAIVHDIGIKPAEEKYGDCNGKLQEKEGPAVVRKLLNDLGYEPEVIERVSYLVGHHHTYTNVDGADYRILIEADFLVNLYEDKAGSEAVKTAYDKIFKTGAGRNICKTMFGL
ncbi:MAG: HD domain-containing protein [Lachnospiraceae bacterium]